ncbi:MULTISPECIES: hypothetical protein [unclassified Microbacterium]|uniref:hypothetical protein n=1 Tax=unclassified Microbacterium TaxID=2609290 RepID=UPI003863B925
MTNGTKQETPVAVWYFIGATFLGTLPSMLFGDLEWWMRVIFLVLALALIFAGFVQLRKESGWGRPKTDDQPPAPTPPPTV